MLIDVFDRSLCFMAFWLDMTSSEAGHWSVWSYVLHGSYASCRNIRVALVLERRWHILRLSKHQCLWMRPLPKIRVHLSTHRHIIYDLYEYIGYIRIHRSLVRWHKGNKHEMYLFLFHFYTCTGLAHTFMRQVFIALCFVQFSSLSGYSYQINL